MKHIAWTAGLFVLAMLAAACSDGGASSVGEKTSAEAGRAEAGPINYTIETVAGDLDHPWSLAFLPDGDMLVTERTGKLKHIGADGTHTIVKDFNTLPEYPVHHGNGLQAGLFDVALDPAFETNSYIYLSYAAKVGERKNTLRLVRARYEGGVLGELQELFLASPARVQGNHCLLYTSPSPRD